MSQRRTTARLTQLELALLEQIRERLQQEMKVRVSRESAVNWCVGLIAEATGPARIETLPRDWRPRLERGSGEGVVVNFRLTPQQDKLLQRAGKALVKHFDDQSYQQQTRVLSYMIFLAAKRLTINIRKLDVELRRGAALESIESYILEGLEREGDDESV